MESGGRMDVPNTNRAGWRKIAGGLTVLLSAALAVWVGFAAFPAQEAIALAVRWGYYWQWMIFLTLTVSTLLAIRRHPPHWRRPNWMEGLVLAGALAVMFQAKPLLRIYDDEPAQLLTSYSMYRLGEASLSFQVYREPEEMEITVSLLDKRPFFYPFALSLLHRVAGYDREHAFLLNGVAGAGLLVLLLDLGRRIGGAASGGWLAVGLTAGIPLTSILARSGGFEMVNAWFLCWSCWWTFRFWQQPSAVHLAVLLFSAAALAHIRYESAFYLLPIFAVVVCRCPTVLTHPLLLCLPWFFLDLAWQFPILSLKPDLLQLADKPSAHGLFSLQYWPQNIEASWNFFFNRQGLYPVSHLLSGAFLLALLRWTGQVTRRAASVPFSTGGPLLIWTIAGLTMAGILHAYFYGQFTDPVIARISYPLHLFQVFLVVRQFAPWVSSCRPGAWLVGALLSLQILWLTVPYLRDGRAEPGVESAWQIWREARAAEWGQSRVLLIDARPIPWTAMLHTAVQIDQLDREKLYLHWRAGTFDRVFAVQRWRRATNGDWVLEPGYALPEWLSTHLLRSDLLGGGAVRIDWREVTAVEGRGVLWDMLHLYLLRFPESEWPEVRAAFLRVNRP